MLSVNGGISAGTLIRTCQPQLCLCASQIGFRDVIGGQLSF